MDKVAVITGASSGIGKVVAITLHEQGYRVYGTSRQPEKYQLPFSLVEMDVENEYSVKNGVDRILEETGRIDVLVNNAGTSVISPVEESTDDIIESVFTINVYGPLRVCRSVLPAMRQQGEGGHIINISSIAGSVGVPFRGIYSASKAALKGYSEAMRMEVKPFGIKVVIVEPGGYKTNINENRKVGEKSPQSPYREACDNTEQLINEEVANAKEPLPVGQLVAKILRKKHPSLIYRSGPWLQRNSPIIKKILPDHWFEALLMRHYGLK